MVIRRFGVKNKKAGIFLSIEMVAVIIVVVVLIAAVVATTTFLLDMQKQQSLIGEIKMYLEASSKFSETYQKLPGELTGADKVGELNSGNIRTLSGTTGVTNYYYGGIETFRQMALAGLIPASLVDLTVSPFIANPLISTQQVRSQDPYCDFFLSAVKTYYISPNGTLGVGGDCTASKNYINHFELLHAGRLVPRSRFNKNLYWYSSTDSSFGTKLAEAIVTSTGYVNGGANNSIIQMAQSLGLNNAQRFISLSYKYAFIDLGLALTSYSSSANATVSPITSVLANRASASFTSIPANTTIQAAALSSGMAKKIDTKIDDGYPGTGIVMGENVYPASSSTTAMGCHNFPVTCASGTCNPTQYSVSVSADLTTLKTLFGLSGSPTFTYLDNDDYSPTRGCVMFFRIG